MADEDTLRSERFEPTVDGVSGYVREFRFQILGREGCSLWQQIQRLLEVVWHRVNSLSIAVLAGNNQVH